MVFDSSSTSGSDSLHLVLTVNQHRTVLPRCLQILSRRGFVLLDLSTDEADLSHTKLSLTVRGPGLWHKAVPELISKLQDVKNVETIER